MNLFDALTTKRITIEDYSVYCDMQPLACQNQTCNFTGVYGELLQDTKQRKLICPDCSGSKFKLLN